MKQNIRYFIYCGGFFLLGCMPPAQQGQQHVGPGDFIVNTVLFILTAFGVYWLLLIHPQQKKEHDLVKMQESLKKGDDVITSGGILGKIVSSAPEAVTVEIAPNCRIRVQWEHVMPVQVISKNASKVENQDKLDKKEKK